MAMMDWVAGAIGSVNTAGDIAKSLLSLKVDAAVTAKVVELNNALLELQRQLNTAQLEHVTLTSRIGELETEIAQFERWEEEKQRYQLTKTDAGTLLYRLKPDCLDGEPEHDLCPVCFQEAVKSILQVGSTGDVAHCPKCKTSIRLKGYRDQLAEIARIGRDLNGPDRGF